MSASAVPADLAGAYRLRPGRDPAIAGARPVLEGGRLAALLQGLPAARAPGICGAVFTLCAHAHRRTSEAAVHAALGMDGPEDQATALRYDTTRDHLRAIALDWPARAGAPPELAWLRAAPLRIAGAGARDADEARALLHAFAEWLAREVLHGDPEQWLALCAAPETLRAWCKEQAGTCAPARLLLQWHAAAERIAVPCEPLPILDPAQRDTDLRALADSLAREPSFAQFPTWRGAPRETGPWARQRHTPARLPTTAWQRLAARWIELVELACTDAPLLQQGALRLAPGEAIAWCEMARGLLLHWVRLDGAGCVDAYRVLAPTEWNFHPRGPLARALQRLATDDAEAAALLGAAFDACVPCSVDAGP